MRGWAFIIMSVGACGGGLLLRGGFCFGSVCQDKHGLKGHSTLEYLMIQRSRASDLQANKGEDRIHRLEPWWFVLDYWVYKKEKVHRAIPKRWLLGEMALVWGFNTCLPTKMYSECFAGFRLFHSHSVVHWHIDILSKAAAGCHSQGSQLHFRIQKS